MTQEEKLEEAKRLYETVNADQKYVLERLFPELRESEDEKIREKVIDVLKLNIRGAESQMQASRGVDRTFEVYACNKVIAWLEKQGEQKPTWSEVDNFMYNKIKNLLTDISLAPESRNSLFDWFKSLKSRVQPQQGWSEEDEEIRNNCIYWLEKARKYFEKDEDLIYDKKWIVKCTDWLKSLKDRVQPQTTWKPSDEQIKVLDAAVMHSHLTTAEYDELVKLREQLKKLREE